MQLKAARTKVGAEVVKVKQGVKSKLTACLTLTASAPTFDVSALSCISLDLLWVSF